YLFCIYFFKVLVSSKTYTLSLHDALPISKKIKIVSLPCLLEFEGEVLFQYEGEKAFEKLRSMRGDGTPINAIDPQNEEEEDLSLDRKSTRLNSSHVKISYAVFCLKKKISR